MSGFSSRVDPRIADLGGQIQAYPEALHERTYLTVREVADLARCEHKTVRKAIVSGRLLAFRVAARLLIRETDARDWIEASPARTVSRAPDRTRLSSKPTRPNRRSVPGSVADLRAIEREAKSR